MEATKAESKHSLPGLGTQDILIKKLTNITKELSKNLL